MILPTIISAVNGIGRLVKNNNTNYATQQLGNVVASVLDLAGLGEGFRRDILNVDRYADKVRDLDIKLAEINNKYDTKIERQRAQLDALMTSGLPIPSVASRNIAQMRDKLSEEIIKLQNNKSLVNELANLQRDTLDTSGLTSASEKLYQRKLEDSKKLGERINEKLSEDKFEERL